MTITIWLVGRGFMGRTLSLAFAIILILWIMVASNAVSVVVSGKGNLHEKFDPLPTFQWFFSHSWTSKGSTLLTTT